MKTFWIAPLLAATLVHAASVPEHIENKAFNATKPPVVDEAKPNDTHSIAEWKKASELKLPNCGTTSAWKLSSESTVQGIATKEKNVAVKGKFTRVAAVAETEGKGLKGHGVLDLSSWDSGLPPRDYRVQKHVFGVEEADASVLPFKFTVDKWDASVADWTGNLTLTFKFKGVPVSQTFPAKIHKEGSKAHITTPDTKRFTFLTQAGMKAFAKMMELCNHHYLASYADTALDITLEDTCVQ